MPLPPPRLRPSPGSLLALAILALTAMSVFARPTELYLSPTGNDKATGLSTDAALATFGAARDRARALRAGGKASDGVTVWVGQGRYVLTETLTFGPDEAGSESSPLVFRAAAGARPVICGGPVIRGFVPWRGEVLKCDLQAQGMGGLLFRQLFFQGKRMPLARTPNVDPEDIHGGVWAHVVDAQPQGSQRTFVFNPKEIDPANWQRPTDGRVGVFCKYDWRWNWRPLAAVDAEANTLTLGKDTSYELSIGDRFFVEGIFEELDAPGEWYLDHATSTLYFWPPAPLSEGEVTVPAVRDLLSLRETSDVQFEGFVLEGCDGNGVRMENAHRCGIARSVIRNVGEWGVALEGGTRCLVRGCDISFTGNGGIRLSGGDRANLTPSSHLAENNVLHHVGVFEKTYNTAINIGGVGNTARRNLIYDTPHAGMTLAGNDNVVELNHIHHTNLQSTDTGGIYSCPRDWTQRGNVIRYNLWHDLGGYGKRSSWQPVQNGKVEFEYPHFTWGIYMDDPTSGNIIFGNVLYRVPICGLFTHGGRDNVFENNIVVDCPAFRASRLTPNWPEWERSVFPKFRAVTGPGSPYFQRYPALKTYRLDDGHPEAMTGHKFIGNIVYYTKEGTAWLRGENADSWKGEDRMMLYGLRMREVDFGANEIDRNLVFAEPGIDLFVSLQLAPNDSQNLSWEESRQRGIDVHSLFADPQFVDPANHNYRLRPDSPALKLGFKPIPFDQIGPYKEALRATWPVVEASDAAKRAKPIKQFVQLPGYEPLPAREVVTRDGAGNTFAKLAAGKPVKVAYFGGGIHAANGWRAQLLDWFRKRYPQSDLTEIDASISDCVRGSGFSVYRFQHDVLQHQPDLVLVDFASDDYQTDGRTIQRVIEGVARQAWSADPELDLVFVYAFRTGFETAYAENLSPPTVCAYERVAQRYGIPSINMGYAVAKLHQSGKLSLKGDPAEGQESFSTDGVRPTGAGNRIYAEALARGFEQLATNAKATPHPLPAPLLPDSFETARLEPITAGPAGRADMLQGEWRELPKDDPVWRGVGRHFDTLWFTNTPGAKLTFTFTGTECSLFDMMGPDTGQVKVTVDGKVTGIHKQVDPWAYYHRLAAIPIASGLPFGAHTVTVELLPEPPNRSVAIESAKKKNRYDPKLFEGVALRVGWIRVR